MNTYLFSNLWHKASSINLLCSDLDKIQSEGNDYVCTDCYFRPERSVNYICKQAGGLEINHVRSKAAALFIKILLEETNCNIYIDAVIRKFCKDEDVYPVPVKPYYVDKRLISTIKLVIGSIQRCSTKNTYRLLMKNEFNITEDFHMRIQEVYNDFSLSSALQFTDSKIISLPVRSHMWKLIHRIQFSEFEEAKVKLKSPSCRNCGEENIERIHSYFQCDRVADVGRKFIRVLRVFDPHYSYEEILNFKGKEEHPQLFWFIANTLFYIDKNRRRCNGDLYSAYMRSELETVRLSKFADDDMQISLQIMVELLEQ